MWQLLFHKPERDAAHGPVGEGTTMQEDCKVIFMDLKRIKAADQAPEIKKELQYL